MPLLSRRHSIAEMMRGITSKGMSFLGALLRAIDGKGDTELAEDGLGVRLHQRQRFVRLFFEPLGEGPIRFADAAIRIIHFVERRFVAHYAPSGNTARPIAFTLLHFYEAAASGSPAFC
jgi:hypothetical protein